VLDRVEESGLGEGQRGLRPKGDGWYVVNVADAEGTSYDAFGDRTRFEGESRFPEFGINVRVLQPRQPACLYHRESCQETFLVLSGECIAIVEEEERPMRKGDFLYCPPGTAHVIVGAGNGPSAVLMVGTRKDPEEILYPVSEAAARYGASVETETPSADEAYAGTGDPEPTTIGLPW
jgi:uncharacterized cupin superfamily protein